MIKNLVIRMLAALALVSVGTRQVLAFELGELRADDPAQEFSATKGCGAYCVAIAARLAGVDDVSYQEAAQATDPDGDGACSMAEIVSALRGVGLRAEALHSESKSIPAGLSILHVRSAPTSKEPDHFVVAEGKGPGRYRFYIPPIGSGIDDDERIVALWAGDYVSLKVDEDRSKSWAMLLMSLSSIGGGLVFAYWLAHGRSAEGWRA